jgi:hypothetical protein
MDKMAVHVQSMIAKIATADAPLFMMVLSCVGEIKR